MPRLLAVVRAGADAPAEGDGFVYRALAGAGAVAPSRGAVLRPRGLVPVPVDGDDPADADLDALCPAGSSKTYENSLMDDALVCLAMARQALRKDKDVAAFYRNQAGRYDGFRESLLPDRDTFLKYTVPWSRVPTLLKKQPTYALVCVGCGTARDVEFVADHLKSLPASARVALCDLSPELLAQAKLRVDKLGLADRVDLIQCDITAGPAALAKLGLRSKDSAVVACSYCLTMIPAWKAAVDAMLDLLVDDGALCLIDFTQRFDRASTLVARLQGVVRPRRRLLQPPPGRLRRRAHGAGYYAEGAVARALYAVAGTLRVTCSPAARSASARWVLVR